MALKNVKGSFERMLDKNLQDLVRGIRNHKEEEIHYIAQCIDEIKVELKHNNLASKANAINKLIYLQMLGNEINWAAFNIIEVMSSTKFTYKRIGYLAASQSFHEQTDVIMLTTNLIRKDLSSLNYYDTGVALSGLSCFLTPDLARDLAGDLMPLMMSTKAYIRKKAVLLMYKVFLQFPDALRPTFPCLKEKLEDPDPGVQSAAVNVICELARKNPKNYLSLAPVFFKLMNSSSDNWVLIKIIKLFGALTPLEPRLGKKLIEPLTNLIHSTSAMSLLYECINTIISGIPNHAASIELCVQKLRILIEDSDQNLKYLGLLTMTKILKSHPKSVQTHKDLILNCLDDKDESIRLRALNLLYGMISKKNIMEIVKKLMTHMNEAEGSHYRNELLLKIIDITSQNNYHFITNFEWYVTVLGELIRIDGLKNRELIATQLLDVTIRVPTVREFTVHHMADLLHNSNQLLSKTNHSGEFEVVYAAAWICGEYSEYLSSPNRTLDHMLHPSIHSLPGHIQSILIQNALKLYCHILSKLESQGQLTLANDNAHSSLSNHSCKELTQLMLDKLEVLVNSSDLEVQERAVSSYHLLRYVLKHQQKNEPCGSDVAALFAGEINPVTSKAQRKVPVPDGLDLDMWINKPPIAVLNYTIDSDEKESLSSRKTGDKKKRKNRNVFVISETSREKINRVEFTEDELEQMRQMRIKDQETNPHYLKNLVVVSADGYINLGESDDLPPLEPIENLIGANQLKKLIASKRVFPNSEYYIQQDKINQKKYTKKKIKRRQHIENHEDADNKTNFDVPEDEVVEVDNQDQPNIDFTDPNRLSDECFERSFKSTEELPQGFSANTKKTRKSKDNEEKTKIVRIPDKDKSGKSTRMKQRNVVIIDSSEISKDIDEKKQSVRASTILCDLITTTIDIAEFAELLSSGTLRAKCKTKIKDLSIKNIECCVRYLCKKTRLSLVEEVDNSASLYGTSSEGNHVCLLVKLTDEGGSITIEGKSDNDSLIHGVTSAIKRLISRHYQIGGRQHP